MNIHIKNFVARTIIILFFISAFAIPKISNERSEEGIDYGNIIITEDGNVWETNAPQKDGAKVIVAFNTKGTYNIKDDEIIRRINYD